MNREIYCKKILNGIQILYNFNNNDIIDYNEELYNKILEFNDNDIELKSNDILFIEKKCKISRTDIKKSNLKIVHSLDANPDYYVSMANLQRAVYKHKYNYRFKALDNLEYNTYVNILCNDLNEDILELKKLFKSSYYHTTLDIDYIDTKEIIATIHGYSTRSDDYIYKLHIFNIINNYKTKIIDKEILIEYLHKNDERDKDLDLETFDTLYKIFSSNNTSGFIIALNILKTINIKKNHIKLGLLFYMFYANLYKLNITSRRDFEIYKSTFQLNHRSDLSQFYYYLQKLENDEIKENIYFFKHVINKYLQSPSINNNLLNITFLKLFLNKGLKININIE